MNFAENRKILNDLNRFKSAIPEAVAQMSSISKNHFDKSFANQGFTNETFEQWKPRKKEDRKRPKRAILINTGDLRRSIRVVKFGSMAVRITSDLPYAKIHNEGGEINKAERNAKLYFKLNKSGDYFGGNARFRKKKHSNFEMDVTIGAHTIKMPKRQFVGYSGVMSRKIETKINQIFQKALR